MKSSWRRWLQFSLRTYLIVSVLAALGLWAAMYWLREYWPQLAGSWGPPPSKSQLPDGWVLRSYFRTIRNEQGEESEQRHGSFAVRDEYGRTRCEGRFEANQPAGSWRYYHTSGRTVLTGIARDGVRVGAWSAWHVNGYRRLELGHGESLRIDPPIVHPLYGTNVPPVIRIATREGPAQFWWDNGQPQSRGKFKCDRREGIWTFYDRQGQTIAHGEYRAGRRQGKWTEWDDERTERKVYYAADRRVENAETLPRKLEEALARGDDRTAHAAIDAIAEIGADLVPHLKPALMCDRNHIVQYALATCSEQHLHAGSLLATIERLAESQNPQTRVRALLALYVTASERRAKVLPSLLKHINQELPDRKSQIYPHLATKVPETIRLLEELLDSSDEAERRLAIGVLLNCAACGFEEQFGQSRREDDLWELVQAALKRAAKHDDPYVAYAAQTMLKAREKLANGSYLTSTIPVVGSR